MSSYKGRFLSPWYISGPELHQCSCWRAWPEALAMGQSWVGAWPGHHGEGEKKQEESRPEAKGLAGWGESLPCWQGQRIWQECFRLHCCQARTAISPKCTMVEKQLHRWCCWDWRLWPRVPGHQACGWGCGWPHPDAQNLWALKDFCMEYQFDSQTSYGRRFEIYYLCQLKKKHQDFFWIFKLWQKKSSANLEK